jgi:hypothetical protein
VAGLPKDEVRRYVRELRLFYKEVLVSVCIFVVCLIAWMSTGGSFWPLWVLFAFAIDIALKAVAVGVVNKKACLTKLTSFLSQEWEEKQVDKYIKAYEARQFRDDCEADERDADAVSSASAAASQKSDTPKKTKRRQGHGRSTREGA